MSRTHSFALVAAVVIALPAASPRIALADEPPPSSGGFEAVTDAPPTVAEPAPAEPGLPKLLLGVRIGATIPQAFNKLDTTFIVNLDLAYQFPVFKNRFGLFLGASYTQPTASGTQPTPQTPAPVEWSLTQRDLGLALGLQYLHFVTEKIAINVGAGVKAHLTRNIIAQHAGSADLGENSEDSSRLGALVRLGFGYRLGPGLLGLELQYEYTPIKQLITGDENTSHLAALLGYTIIAR